MTVTEAASAITDASVIAASIEDPATFATLFDRHARSIHRYAARRLGPGLADDLLSETFLQAFRHRARYDTSRPSALPWLYGIASKLICKQRDAETRLYRLAERVATDPAIESHEAMSDARLTAISAHRILSQGLASLRQGDRDVLLLVAWADLNYAAVADALGIPVGTVRSRLNRARRRMREVLGGDPSAIDEGAVS